MGKVLDSIFFSTWWVFGIFVLSFCLFERGVKAINLDLAALNKQIDELHAVIDREEALSLHLQERLSSFEDPAWIELLLIKNLGLIPEGYHKYVLIGDG
jgi:hypothetical protein